MAISSPPPHSLTLAATPFTKRVERRVLNYARSRGAIRPGEFTVVGVSGGPDSTALLVILSRLQSRLESRITAAHFNHTLRSDDEAAEDLVFVRSLASTLNVPLVYGSGGVRARARAHQESIEDAARRLRYAFLAEQAALAGASCVVTGHTMDDQAETVLLHLIRGAGLDGLAGMRDRSCWPFGDGPAIARPLLCLTREETVRYCTGIGIHPREDSTNLAPIATRNKVRHRLVPELRKLNPRIVEAIARLSQSVIEDAGYLEETARHYFPRQATVSEEGVRLRRSSLTSDAPAMGNRWIRLAIESLAGTDAGLEAVHVDAVRKIAIKGRGTVALPNELRVTANSRSLVFTRGEHTKAMPITETRLNVPGVTRLSKWRITTQLLPIPRESIAARLRDAYLDAGKTGRDLTVRSRRAGDRLRPLGLGGEKKLQDVLVDAKVPAAERDGVPLVCRGQDIVWVVGHCIDQRYAIHCDSQQVLHLAAHPH